MTNPPTEPPEKVIATLRGSKTDRQRPGDFSMTDPTTTRYLALYTGPSGPISFEFSARNLDDARRVVGERGRQAFDDAEDCLDLDPDSETLTADIAAVLSAGGWHHSLAAELDGDWTIYRAFAGPLPSTPVRDGGGCGCVGGCAGGCGGCCVEPDRHRRARRDRAGVRRRLAAGRRMDAVTP